MSVKLNHWEPGKIITSRVDSAMEEKAQAWAEATKIQSIGQVLSNDMKELEVVLKSLFKAEREIIAQRNEILSQIELVKKQINRILDERPRQVASPARKKPVAGPTMKDLENEWSSLTEEMRNQILAKAKVGAKK
jgi:hypothetical protein